MNAQTWLYYDVFKIWEILNLTFKVNSNGALWSPQTHMPLSRRLTVIATLKLLLYHLSLCQNFNPLLPYLHVLLGSFVSKSNNLFLICNFEVYQATHIMSLAVSESV